MIREAISRNNVTVSGDLDAACTLLFVHGLGTDQSVWARIAPAFQDNFRLVLMDNAGAIESNRDDFINNQFRYLNMKGYALDVLDVCTALHLSGNTILIGHSMGALAGLIASVLRPKQFRKLILFGLSPCYRNSPGYHGGFEKKDIDNVYAAIRSDYSSWVHGFSQASMGNPDRPELAISFAQHLARIPKEMMLTVLYSVLQADYREDLPKVAAPVCLLQSHDDYFVPASVAEFVKASIPVCDVHMIEATGHLPHVSAPDATIEALKDCLLGD